MQQLTQSGQNLVNDLSRRYNLSFDAVMHMLIAVNNGGGRMAQFNCPELGGSGQWMQGGMTMVGDMFNHGLKMTVDNLCNELANGLSSAQIFPSVPAGQRGAMTSNQWWPAELGSPSSTGSQNNIRYAVFQGRLAVELNGQLTIYNTLDHHISGVSQQQGGDSSLTFSSQYGTVAVSSLPIVSGSGIPAQANTNFAAPPSDKNDQPNQSQNQHQSSGQSPDQSQGPDLSKNQNQNQNQNQSSTQNPIARKDEPSIQHDNTQHHEHQSIADKEEVNQLKMANSTGSDSAAVIIELIEKLGQLKEAGILTEDEFKTKKSELLQRL